jgi:hypothetical protein
MERGTPEDHPQRNEVAVRAGYVRQQTETLLLAPSKGHPALLYQQMSSFLYWAVDLARWTLQEYTSAEAPGWEALNDGQQRLYQGAEELKFALYGSKSAEERATASLKAARELLRLTEQWV